MQSYELLEREWAEFNRVDPMGMVVCSSGTAALHLALESRRTTLDPTLHTVAVPDFTMVACARSVAMVNLYPWFIECGDDLLMTESALKEVLNDREFSLMNVSVYGRSNWDVIRPLIHREAYVIEDLAEAHGAGVSSRTDAACWSFYQNKIVCGEEGGAVWFRDNDLARVARELRSLGFGPNQDYSHRPRGHNYRLANRLADPILISMQDYETNVAERWRSFDAYARETWHERVYFRRRPDAPWVMDFGIRDLMFEEQDWIVTRLKASKVAARHGFKPMTTQPEFRRDGVETSETTLRMSRETVYLPLIGLNNTPLPYGYQREAVRTLNELISMLGDGRPAAGSP